MTKNPDANLTLPSVIADLDGRYQKSRLMLTIAFHPDAKRIGEVAFPVAAGKGQQATLGRNRPEFSLPGESGGRGLDDPYISRDALSIDRHANSTVLQRELTACRCQVEGRELDREVCLTDEQLQQGVAIWLSNRILLLLRELPCQDEVLAATTISSELVGSSPYMQGLKKQIATVAASNLDVLIRGETGTGKELVASAIHANSPDSPGTMVTVNMSAIPPALAPALLFGSAKGAFTGADSAATGYFEQAEGGVLFLDEIGDTPAAIQAQLLRALQQREIQVVGGPVRKIDLRIITATDARLDEGGDFKAALRHRLGACEIVLAPLRQHREDIGELLWFFLRQYLGEMGKSGLLPTRDSDRIAIAVWAELFHVFVLFTWPGNVRQLSNFARQVALASDTRLLLPANLREQLEQRSAAEVNKAGSPRRSADIAEGEFLAAMASSNYEPTAAARILKIPRTAVYRRMEDCGLRTASGIPEAELQEVLASCDGDVNKAAEVLKVSPNGLRKRLRSINRSQQ